MSGPESSDWRRLHPLTPILRSVQLLFAVFLAIFASRIGGPTLIVLASGLALFALLITLSYVRYRYRVTAESLIISHGVLFRRRRVIPRSRIQNVDLRAGPLQRLLGVVSARVETAGGQGTEATLQVVGRAEGLRLRDSLVARAETRADVVAPAPTTEPAPRLEQLSPPEIGGGPEAELSEQRVGVADLVIAGATSNRAGLLVAALLGGDYFLDVLPTDWLLRRVLPAELLEPDAAVESLVQTAQHDVQAFLLGLAVVVLFFGLAGWALSILASVARFYDFTLARAGGDIRVGYGLFTRREKGFRRSRVQNVQIEEPFLRRWLKLATVRVQTAGYGPGMKADERVETLTPITRARDIDRYLDIVCPGLEWQNVEWRPSHPRAKRRLFIRRALVVVLASFVTSLLVGRWGWLALGALLPAWLLASAHYRHLGHARLGDYILVREGLWTRRSHIVPLRKLQALHFRQSPFQLRLGLGTLNLETAGGPSEWHGPRSIDLGAAYGREMMEGLASEVTATGLMF